MKGPAFLMKNDLISKKFQSIFMQSGKYEPRKWKANADFKQLLQQADMGEFVSFDEKVAALRAGLSERPRCHCGKVTSPDPAGGFKVSCSVKCAAQAQTTKEKIAMTNEQRYGGHYTQNESWKREFIKLQRDNNSWAKGKDTLKAKLGVSSVFGLPQVREKIAQTHLDRYGVLNPQQDSEVKEKTRQTRLKNKKQFK
jgi:hypothetical protein